MRFQSICYEHFGPFDQLSLDVSGGRYGLHLLYGRNEAGKSSALRGLRYFLFGFPHETPDNFKHAYDKFRVGARLQLQDGRELHAIRRKGKINTLRGADDKTVIPETELTECMGRLEQAQFNMLFGLDHEQLVAGGAEILEGKGNLGEALFAAGAGLAGLRRIERGLLERQQKLYKARGKEQEIAKHLRALEDNQQTLKQKTLLIETYSTKVESHRQALQNLENLETERAAQRKERDRLLSYQAALPLIGPWQDAREQLQPLRQVPLLDAAFAGEHRKAIEGLLVAGANRARAEAERSRLEAELTRSTPPAGVMELEKEIDQLRGRLGATQKAEQDRPLLVRSMEGNQRNVRHILRRLFKKDDISEATSFIPDRAVQDQIRSLISEHEAIRQAEDEAHARVEQRKNQIVNVEELIADLPSVPDVGSLSMLVQRLLAEGPLERNYQQTASSLQELERKARQALSRLQLWHGSLEQVEALPIPSAEAISLHQNRLQRAHQECTELEQKIAQSEDVLRVRRLKMAEIARGDKVPSEDELHNARQSRDAGWQLIRREWRDHHEYPDARTAFVAQFAPADNLADAYEHSVRRGDDLADRLRREADRVSQLGQLRDEVQATEEALTDLRKALQTARVAAGQKEQAWRDIWKPAGIEPLSPEEMRAWSNDFQQLRRVVEDLVPQREALVRRHEMIEQAKALLLAQLNEPTAQQRSLAEMLDIGQQRVRRASELAQQREKLAHQLQQLHLELKQEERQTAQVREREKSWKERWRKAVSAIGLGGNDAPETANGYLSEIAVMQGELKQAEGWESRIKGIDLDTEVFLQAVSQLLNKLGGVPQTATKETMQELVQGLSQALQDARRLRAEHETLRKLWEKAGQEYEEASRQQVQLQARLKALAQQAGVDDPDKIPQLIQQATQRQHLERQVEQYAGQLHQLARGEDLGAFVNAAMAARESLETRLEELKTREPLLDEEIKQQAILAKEAQDQITAWERGEGEAAICAAEGQMLLASLREQVREYAMLYLARKVLNKGIERFRQRHQGDLLERAQDYFGQLTCGSFPALEVDDSDRGQPTLLGLRADGTRVGVEGMSDGTRDQLFLSLRLAGIELHLKDREPVPLIVDDILVNYDDARALATLKALAQLSQRTQVLFFTHHEHLVNLALEHLPKDVVFRQELQI